MEDGTRRGCHSGKVYKRFHGKRGGNQIYSAQAKTPSTTTNIIVGTKYRQDDHKGQEGEGRGRGRGDYPLGGMVGARTEGQ